MQDNIQKLEEEKAKIERRIRKIKFIRKILFISFFIFFMIFILYSIILYYGIIMKGSIALDFQKYIYYTLIFLTAIVGLILIILHISCNLLQINLEELERRINTKKILEQQYDKKNINGDNTYNYFNSLVEINIDNLNSYYILVKKSAEKSFYVSIISGIIGFILIITGLILGFIFGDNKDILSYLTIGSGTITEFIAGTFFYLYNKTIRQMKEYHDSLVSVQNILLSFKLIQDTKETEQRAKLIELIIQYLTMNNHIKKE